MRELYYFTKMELETLRENLQERTTMFAPCKNSRGEFEWQEGGDIFDYYGNTTLPPKQYFLPQAEKLFSYQRKDGKVEISAADEEVKQVTFWGIRPCDIKAIEILDKIFLAESFVDDKYKERRDKAYLISFYCQEPYETCFCTSLPYDLIENDTYDLLFIKITDTEYLAAIANHGENLLQAAGLSKKLANEGQLAQLEAKQKSFNDAFKIKFDFDSESKDLETFFETDPYFSEVAMKCLGCGICSYVCPTCYCFTIADTKQKHSGCRMRCWDHCMHADYTVMAGGHNPRNSKAARIRQRFLHKGRYIPELYNDLGCVGCGRCLAKCPVGMDICDGLKHVHKDK